MSPTKTSLLSPKNQTDTDDFDGRRACLLICGSQGGGAQQ